LFGPRRRRECIRQRQGGKKEPETASSPPDRNPWRAMEPQGRSFGETREKGPNGQRMRFSDRVSCPGAEQTVEVVKTARTERSGRGSGRDPGRAIRRPNPAKVDAPGLQASQGPGTSREELSKFVVAFCGGGRGSRADGSALRESGSPGGAPPGTGHTAPAAPQAKTAGVRAERPKTEAGFGQAMWPIAWGVNP
jgi:hypothetical protein